MILCMYTADHLSMYDFDLYILYILNYYIMKIICTYDKNIFLILYIHTKLKKPIEKQIIFNLKSTTFINKI